jgi:hypothetical protein
MAKAKGLEYDQKQTFCLTADQLIALMGKICPLCTKERRLEFHHAIDSWIHPVGPEGQCPGAFDACKAGPIADLVFRRDGTAEKQKGDT